ncbi:hypothetical protein HHK36_023586 [Tetracentron sinense]|uniref:Nuclease HARBI1 n=1 Tax=Tetracentron sinense TaxID=13715 RepID=A0A834YLN0_TETSI|nr:hypothetical protein HHK36_023586 [Tetracentron sinense]
MQRSLFLRIQSAVEAHDPYFVQKTNVVGTLGLSSLQKITAAMRMLAYGVAADYVDEYVRIGESTAIESLKKFVKAVVAIFSDEYLRSPNNDDTARLLAVGENRGFPGMLEGIDFNYSINGHDYTMGYYLANGIYPKWSTFVKTIPITQENRQKYFAAAQGSARKDVERAFGVLQARFVIVRGPACFWECNTLKDIMKACIIMHNMIVEDERDVNGIDFIRGDIFRKHTLEKMFTNKLMESANDELSFRTVVRDLRTKSPMLQIVLLNPYAWCCTGYCFGTEGTTGPVSKKNLHLIAKMLFSDCSNSTKANLRMIEECVTKNQADEVYMLTHQIKELIESLKSS